MSLYIVMSAKTRRLFVHESVRSSISADATSSAPSPPQVRKRAFRDAETSREYHDLQLAEFVETIKYDLDSTGKPKYEVLGNLLWTATKRDVIFFSYDLSNVLKAYFANEPHVYIATNRCVMSVAMPHLYNLQRSVKIHQEALKREYAGIVGIIHTLVNMGIKRHHFHYTCLRAYICGTIANSATYLFHERDTFANSLEHSSTSVNETNYVYIAMIHVLEDLIDGTRGDGRCDLTSSVRHIAGASSGTDDEEPYEYLRAGGEHGTTKSANHELNEASIHYFLAMYHYSPMSRHRHKKLAHDAFDRAFDIRDSTSPPPYAACEFIASQLESLKMRINLLSRCPESSQMPPLIYDRLTTPVARLDDDGRNNDEDQLQDDFSPEAHLDLFASKPTGVCVSVRDI